jgi:hypothetical protein
LPDSFILAVNQKGRFHEDIAGIPKMSLQEWGQRRLYIMLRSDGSAAALKRASDSLEACKGEAKDAQLFAYLSDKRRGCRLPVHRNGAMHVAQYDRDWLLEIECREESFRGLGCKVRFPFEGFAAEVSFHQRHLPNWRQVLDQADAFLKSKKYQ